MKKHQSTIARLPENNASKKTGGKKEGGGGIDREALLEVVRRGGKPALGRPPEGRRRTRLTLRIDSDIIPRIDAAANGRDVPISVNQWIVEAVIAQLKKEGR